MKPSFFFPRGNKGSILVLTFWALSFLAFFAVHMGSASRQRLTLAERLSQREELRLAAEAGIQKGAAELKKAQKNPGVESLQESWADSGALFKDFMVGNAAVSVRYDYPDDKDNKPRTRYGIVDEERKININTASLDVLKRLFKTLWSWPDAEAEELASAIIDWRDSDESPLPEGAESNYYQGLKYPYACKNAKFDIPDELLLVRGVTATIYNDLKSYVTVFGSGVVNANTAPRPVLIALGLDEKLADKVIAFRWGEDLAEGTQDDRMFSGPSTILPQLSQAVPLDAKETASLSNVVASGLLGTSSENFMISSYAGYPYKKGEALIVGVFERAPLEAGGYQGKFRYRRIVG